MFQTHCERWQSLIPILWRTALCISDQSVNQLSRSSLMHSFVLCHQPIRRYICDQSVNQLSHSSLMHSFILCPQPLRLHWPLARQPEHAVCGALQGCPQRVCLRCRDCWPGLQPLLLSLWHLCKTQLGFVGLTCRGRVIVELGWQSLWKDSRGRSVWCFGENDVRKERLPGFVGQTDG